MYCLASVEARITGYPGRPDFSRTASVFGVVITAILTGRFVVLLIGMIRSGERRPISALIEALKAAWPSFVVTLAGAGALTLFLVSIGWMKSMLPIVAPFWADGALARIDLILWGGRPAFPLPLVQSTAYAIWQAAHLGTILWVLHWREGCPKDRAIIALVLCWALGICLAYAVSSAGPIFTGFVPADRLAQMEARYLWASYTHQRAAIGAGISAFPSMHVTMALWIALVLRQRHLGWLGIPFVAFVSMGALTLGWHYSADVVGGVLIALVAWKLAGLSKRRSVNAVSPGAEQVGCASGRRGPV